MGCGQARGITCEKNAVPSGLSTHTPPSTFSRHPPIHLPRSATYRTPNGLINFLSPRSHHKTRLGDGRANGDLKPYTQPLSSQPDFETCDLRS